MTAWSKSASSGSHWVEQTEDSRLSKVPTIDLFGWGVRGEDGRQYDSIQTLEEAMRPQLDPNFLSIFRFSRSSSSVTGIRLSFDRQYDCQ